MNFSKRLKGTVFSPRSQGSYRREAVLRKQLQAVQEIIARCKRVADNEQAHIDELSRNSLTGESWAGALIPKSLAKIQEQKGQIAVFEPQGAKIRAQIDALLKPSPAGARERAENQRALAELVLERLESDRRLANFLQTARALLEKRAGMTNRIWELGQKIDLQLDARGVDERLLSTLETVVRCDLEAQSEKWADWLFGRNQKTEPYVVRDDRIVFAETLARANVYERGDRVDLTAEEVEEIRAMEETRRGNVTEVLRDGAIRVGASIEVRHSRVEKIAEAG